MGFEQIKLYYMVGLPGETGQDRAVLVEQVRAIASGLALRARLKISLNPFVPKPQTRRQDEPMLAPEGIKAALNQVRRGLAREKRVELQCETPAASLVQALISLGDRRLADALQVSAPESRGFMESARRAGIDTQSLLHQRKKPSTPRPWRLVE